MYCWVGPALVSSLASLSFLLCPEFHNRTDRRKIFGSVFIVLPQLDKDHKPQFSGHRIFVAPGNFDRLAVVILYWSSLYEVLLIVFKDDGYKVSLIIMA